MPESPILANRLVSDVVLQFAAPPDMKHVILMERMRVEQLLRWQTIQAFVRLAPFRQSADGTCAREFVYFRDDLLQRERTRRARRKQPVTVKAHGFSPQVHGAGFESGVV